MAEKEAPRSGTCPKCNAWMHAGPCETCSKCGTWRHIGRKCDTGTGTPAPRENQDMSKGGVKFDLGKTRLGLIAPEFLEGLGRVLTAGAKKYSDHNWSKGMHWTRAYDALLRHTNAWNAGEDLDAESGMPHLWHAAAELMFLVAFEARKSGTDDRFRAEPSARAPKDAETERTGAGKCGKCGEADSLVCFPCMTKAIVPEVEPAIAVTQRGREFLRGRGFRTDPSTAGPGTAEERPVPYADTFGRGECAGIPYGAHSCAIRLAGFVCRVHP